MRAYVIAIVLVIALGATAPPASAEGFRAEIHGGWDRIQGADQDDGILYGIGLGYDLNVGRDAFLRVDLSFDNSTMRERETGANVANDIACLRAGRDLAAGIRAGVNASERGDRPLQVQLHEPGRCHRQQGRQSGPLSARCRTPAWLRHQDVRQGRISLSN